MEKLKWPKSMLHYPIYWSLIMSSSSPSFIYLFFLQNLPSDYLRSYFLFFKNLFKVWTTRFLSLSRNLGLLINSLGASGERKRVVHTLFGKTIEFFLNAESYIFVFKVWSRFRWQGARCTKVFFSYRIKVTFWCERLRWCCEPFVLLFSICHELLFASLQAIIVIL